MNWGHSQIATHAGTDAEQLVKDTVMRLVEEDKRFAAVCRGVEQADRGESLPHKDVVARIEQLSLPQSGCIRARTWDQRASVFRRLPSQK